MGDFTIREEVRSVFLGYELFTLPFTLRFKSPLILGNRDVILSKRELGGKIRSRLLTESLKMQSNRPDSKGEKWIAGIVMQN